MGVLNVAAVPLLGPQSGRLRLQRSHLQLGRLWLQGRVPAGPSALEASSLASSPRSSQAFPGQGLCAGW